VEVRHVEQFRLPVGKPLGPCQALALRAVSIATRVVCDTLMTTIAATFDVTAVRRRAAALYRDHSRRRAPDSDAPCCSRKAGPKWRNTSATSSPSRDMTRPSGGHQAATWAVMGARLPADWRWRRPCWWRYADNEMWCSGCDAPAAIEWCVDRRRTPAGGRRTRGAGNAG
jgi:hypothetical protein